MSTENTLTVCIIYYADSYIGDQLKQQVDEVLIEEIYDLEKKKKLLVKLLKLSQWKKYIHPPGTKEKTEANWEVIADQSPFFFYLCKKSPVGRILTQTSLNPMFFHIIDPVKHTASEFRI